MNKIKEELKAKEIVKEAEQRRRGNVLPDSPSHCDLWTTRV